MTDKVESTPIITTCCTRCSQATQNCKCDEPMGIEELIKILSEKQADYEVSNQATVVKNWGHGIKQAIDIITQNRTRLEAQKPQVLPPEISHHIFIGRIDGPDGKYTILNASCLENWRFGIISHGTTIEDAIKAMNSVSTEAEFVDGEDG